MNEEELSKFTEEIRPHADVIREEQGYPVTAGQLKDWIEVAKLWPTKDHRIQAEHSTYELAWRLWGKAAREVIDALAVTHNGWVEREHVIAEFTARYGSNELRSYLW